MTHPAQHVSDAQKLRPDGYADLWEITLLENEGVLRFWNNPTTTWQEETYQGLACSFSGEGQSSDDESKRPTLQVHNPGDIFVPYVLNGTLEGAIATRKRVLGSHLRDDLNIFKRRIWRVAAIPMIGDQVISIELRDPEDGANFLIPGRIFMPPEFPAVDLRG